MLKKNPVYIKLTSWEYWPMWILYIPVWIQHFWLSIKARSLFFFLKTNPGIKEGFILSDSKYNTLKLVPKEYLPETILIRKDNSFQTVIVQMKQAKISFPVIFKPDIGFRGLLVHKINNEKELRNILETIKVDYLLQEYIDYKVEIGIFYMRLPKKPKGKIPSITIKEFLSVTGNGINTLEELISKKPRAILHKNKLKNKFKDSWNDIVPEGKKIVLESIGNHNRGTKFMNGNYLYDENLQKVFDDLNKKMPGFYFGRFDIRTRSVEDLKQGANFKILEVNGVGAEPTHVYDPDYKLVKAWKDMLYLWKMIYKIAMQNKKQGEKFPVYPEAKKRWRFYKDYKKLAFRD
ncbi:D-alanine--D-alanine ligase [Abyssalbus ytuae]|uniref:D-alanine--D-alanine ligase n=1 Tax=Abyssalbus ytuae TaxID=2926907 RepID=A0A9E6ZPP2_9FLAO|nr:D-alanine--D-alanine ligase [Abyssalbus ytuae]UOB18255.1 D-alanine--D-alanine ligase [Abyssalbus ytuae]